MTYNGEIYFKPEWGNLDIVTGNKVSSAYGGAADRENFGETLDFVATKIPAVQYSYQQTKIFSLYQKIRDVRSNHQVTEGLLKEIFQNSLQQAPQDWLLYVELLELSLKNKTTDVTSQIQSHLEQIMKIRKDLVSVIEDGIKLAHA